MLIDSLIVQAMPCPYYLEIMFGDGVACPDAMMMYRGRFL